MDLVDCARLYALTSIASADAFIAVFDAKYAHNLWRPVTAIRNADLTSNPATPREASWQPLGVTPMHPEYPCAHCIVSSAIATVLQHVVGNEVGEIALVSPTAPGVTRKWTRLQDYSDEVSSARIYAGFHYRFSTEAGKEMGKKIGDLAVTTLMPGAVADAKVKSWLGRDDTSLRFTLSMLNELAAQKTLDYPTASVAVQRLSQLASR